MANIISDPADFRKLLGVADSWVAIAVFTDVLITALLLFYLSRSRTGFKKTDSIISHLIKTAIETAAVGAIFCIADLIVFTTHSDTNLHFLFALPQARLYTNTLMTTLNSRLHLRNELDSTDPQSFAVTSGTGRFKHTEVSIAVTQDIQLDGMKHSSPSLVHQESLYGDDRKVATVA